MLSGSEFQTVASPSSPTGTHVQAAINNICTTLRSYYPISHSFSLEITRVGCDVANSYKKTRKKNKKKTGVNKDVQTSRNEQRRHFKFHVFKDNRDITMKAYFCHKSGVMQKWAAIYNSQHLNSLFYSSHMFLFLHFFQNEAIAVKAEHNQGCKNRLFPSTLMNQFIVLSIKL